MTDATMLAISIDPSLTLDLTGIDSDPWQRALLRSEADKILLCCHRQAGKSTATAALGIWTALVEPASLTIVVSASQRQANETFRKIVTAYKLLGTPVPLVEDSATTLALANGSRIVSLPDSPDTIVGFSGPQLIIADEAARVSDATFIAVRPMLTASRGRMVAMSTPRGRLGWYYTQWHDPLANWERIAYRASENPRIDPAWLADERQILGPVWYEQEYELEFLESELQFFSTESIGAAFSDRTLKPLFPEGIEL
jgi:hypothetical protein